MDLIPLSIPGVIFQGIEPRPSPLPSLRSTVPLPQAGEGNDHLQDRPDKSCLSPVSRLRETGRGPCHQCFVTNKTAPEVPRGCLV